MGLFWDSAEQKLAKEKAAAEAEVLKTFDAWTAQLKLVAEKTKILEKMEGLAEASQKQFQEAAAKYDSGLTTKNVDSPEVSGLRSNFLIRQNDVISKNKEVAECLKDKQAAIGVLIQKEKDKIAAERKFEDLKNPKPAITDVPKTIVVETVKESQKTEIPSSEPRRGNFKDIHQQLENSMRFRGVKHDEPMQKQDINSLKRTPGHFEEIHKKLEKTMHFEPAKTTYVTPRNTPVVGQSSINQDAEQAATRRLLCQALQEKFNSEKKSELDPELKDKIRARRYFV